MSYPEERHRDITYPHHPAPVSYTHLDVYKRQRMGLLIQEEAIEHVRKVAERERAPMYVCLLYTSTKNAYE